MKIQKCFLSALCTLCSVCYIGCRDASSEAPATTAYRTQPTWETKMPELKVLYPPQALLAIDPLFTFKEPLSERTYIIRTLGDQEFVTVRDAHQPERFADPLERAYALAQLEFDWRELNLSDRLKQHHERRRKELEHEYSVLNTRIHYKEKAIRDVQDEIEAITIRIRANEDVGINLEETRALKKELEERTAERNRLQTELELLKYEKALRDTAAPFEFVIEAVDVSGILSRYNDETGEALVRELRKNVSPHSWGHPKARLEVRQRFLLIRNTKKVVDEVKGYVERLRHS